MKFSNSFGFVYVHKCGLGDQKKKKKKSCKRMLLPSKKSFALKANKADIPPWGSSRNTEGRSCHFNEPSQGEEYTQ